MKGRPRTLDKGQTSLVPFAQIVREELRVQVCDQVIAEVMAHEVELAVKQAGAYGGGWVLHWMAGSHETVVVSCEHDQPYLTKQPPVSNLQ